MADREKNFISAVIYVHNAEQKIEGFLQMIINALEDHFENSEIICVNDCCQDKSEELIKKVSMRAGRTSISILTMSYFHGIEMAMNAGVDLAIGDFVFEFDSVNPDFAQEEIMRVYRRALEGYDIVSASADRKEKFTSRMFYRAFEQFSNLPYKMSTESFRILSRRVINRISSMNRTVPYRKAVYAGCGLKTDNIRYSPVGSEAELPDKVQRRYRAGLAMDVLILFTQVGYRFSVAMTVLMMLISVFMVLYSVVIYVTAHPVEGWTTTILFLSVAFGGLFGILTVIIKYLQLLVDLTFKRKHYSFEKLEKLTR